MKYTLKNNSILDNGHTMFLEDVVQNLNRKEYLENKRKELIFLYKDIDDYEYNELKTQLYNILFKN